MVFIVGLLLIILVGLIHPLGLHQAQQGSSLVATKSVQAVTVLLILKAFSAGCSALTGVEAIANGVPLFKEPRAVLAKRTELLLGLLLGTMLLGLAVLARRWHIGPRSGETVLSQIMAMAVGRSWAYYIVSITITIVLALAANTSYGGLPVLASLMARDNYLPHLFSLRGDRQVFSNGIWALTVAAGVLLVAVDGNTNTLIPLFAIGVFTGFTLSQTGLVVHWRRTRPPHWRRRAAINGFGAFVTFVATLIFLFTKFTEGAWVVVVAVPALIWLFSRVHAYYARAAQDLAFDKIPPKPVAKDTTVIVPVNRLSRLTEHALCEAKSLGQRVVAITVVLQGDEESSQYAENLEREWAVWDPGVPLEVLRTEFSSVVDPIVDYIDRMRRESDDQLVVLIPSVVPSHLRFRALHNHIDLVLSTALRSRSDIVVARVSVPVESEEPEEPEVADSQQAPEISEPGTKPHP
jgi:hypothetical protein